MTATYYRDKIVEICAKMFSIRPLIHSSNRNAVDKYLQTVWKRVCTLTSSLVSTSQADTLQARFQSYVDAEEQRLREGLETVRYDIDAIDTLSLITGPGRIEKVRISCPPPQGDSDILCSTSFRCYTFSSGGTSRFYGCVGRQLFTRTSYGTQPTPWSGCLMRSTFDITILRVRTRYFPLWVLTNPHVALFKQQKLDVNQQFKNWASELVS